MQIRDFRETLVFRVSFRLSNSPTTAATNNKYKHTPSRRWERTRRDKFSSLENEKIYSSLVFEHYWWWSLPSSAGESFSRQQNVELKCSAWKTHFSLFSYSTADCHERCTSWVSQNCRKKKQHNNTMEHNPCFKKWWKMLVFDCRLLHTYTTNLHGHKPALSHSPEVHSTWHLMGIDADNSSTAQQSDCFIFHIHTMCVTYNKLPTVCGKSSKKYSKKAPELRAFNSMTAHVSGMTANTAIDTP